MKKLLSILGDIIAPDVIINKLNMNNPFINLEDEIELRRSLRAVFSHEGFVGLYKVMGELSQSLQITAQITQEIMDEENNNIGPKNN